MRPEVMEVIGRYRRCTVGYESLSIATEVTATKAEC